MTYLEVLCMGALFEPRVYALRVVPKKGSKSKGSKRHWLCAMHLRWKYYNQAGAPAHATEDYIVRKYCEFNRIVGVNQLGHVKCKNCR